MVKNESKKDPVVGHVEPIAFGGMNNVRKSR
jgi:hypothetical protein